MRLSQNIHRSTCQVKLVEADQLMKMLGIQRGFGNPGCADRMSRVIDIYLEPQMTIFARSTPQNKAFSNQNKDHLGSRYVYIPGKHRNSYHFLGQLSLLGYS